MHKLAVITGGTSGIGLDLRRQLLEDGYEVVVLARDNIYEIDNFIYCDVSDETAVNKAFEEIKSKYNKDIALLVNSAGFGVSGALELAKTEDARKIFDVNVFGVFYSTRAALKNMKAGAKIINISSMTALTPLPYRALYCSTKAAVSMISYGFLLELKKHGIGICNVCPGDVKTNFTKNRVKNFETNERYKDDIESNTNKLDGSRENKRMDVKCVTKAINKQIKKKKMKPMIIVGGKYKVFYFVSKIVPLSWFLWGINKIFNK